MTDHLPGTAISVTHLLAAATPVEWHEAVALVRQAGLLVLTSGSPERLPAPSAIWLLEDGALSMGDGARSDTSLTTQLATLLAALLPVSAPLDLRMLADTRSATVTASTPQAYIEALSFFARPDDASTLRPLWARAVEARRASERDNALLALADRARQPAHDASIGSSPHRKRRRMSSAAAAGIAVAAVALLAAGGYVLSHRAAAGAGAPSPIQGATGEVERKVGLGIESAAAFVRESLQHVPAPAGRGADIELTMPRRRPAPRTNATPIDIAHPPAPPPPQMDPAVAAGGRSPARTLPFGDDARAALAAAPHGVYGAMSADVIPPRLLRARMPASRSDAALSGAPGQLELLIGDDGRVVSAKLLSASNRHQERMMISAAKTWQFAPAMRNGQRVPYRLQMPINW